ncbi:MAG: cytochrome ubiquinol oxidase subunit I [Deltaproteobacteria bacterium]|jgi:cytochrome d ubiquinol oxidase subunit I|nr:cytochrome ubiquinol oxidase subunit I [Deltaproteobacteria bacterium]
MEWFSVEMLSRLQFAVAVFFHFLFVPLTLGLSLIIALMQTKYYRTGDETYKRMAKFWGKIFLINFAVGVVTGITLEFQFGTNWSRYSEYVGAVFGPLLAVEATVAFFMESTFIAVWHFGWNKVGKKLHLASIWLVTIAGNLSALWIILANGFMQHPVGYTEVDGVAHMTDIFALLTNVYAWGAFGHTIFGAWILSGFFVLGISTWHLLRNNDTDFFGRCVKIAAPLTFIATIGLLLVGHLHGNTVAATQPTKLAAMEAHWETRANAPVYLLSYPDEANERNSIEALPIPNLLSILAFNDPSASVTGLKDFPRDQRPPVLITFLSFRLMVGLGGLFLLLSFLTFIFRNNLGEHRLLSNILILNIPLPYIALAAGWSVAEVGRQPWIIYNVLRTGDAASPVAASSVGISLAAFTIVYTFLGIIAFYLIYKNATKIQGGGN